jgi:hypothetical protein
MFERLEFAAEFIELGEGHEALLNQKPMKGH